MRKRGNKVKFVTLASLNRDLASLCRHLVLFDEDQLLAWMDSQRGQVILHWRFEKSPPRYLDSSKPFYSMSWPSGPPEGLLKRDGELMIRVWFVDRQS